MIIKRRGITMSISKKQFYFLEEDYRKIKNIYFTAIEEFELG